MKFKSIMSLLLAVTVATIFSFRSLAFAEVTKTEASADKKNSSDKKASSSDTGSALAGTLATDGYVMINNNEARTGATIMSGDTVATGPDSDASIDLGPLGRIQLRPSTKIKLMLSEKNCQILVQQCGSLTHFVPAGVLSQARREEAGLMEVAVLPGEARVTAGKGNGNEVMIKTGENRVFETFESMTANGETTYTLNCCDCAAPAGVPFLPLGFWGLLAVGVTTGVGVVTGSDDSVSPVFP